MNKMIALIQYFSGTGNSLHAAHLIGEELKQSGYEIIFHAIENGLYNRIQQFNLHLFFFPIYATSVPHIMCKYINRLQSGNGAKAAIISTNGRINTRFRDGYQGWALLQARLLLRLKKYDVFFSDTLDYPHNITAFFPPRSVENNQKIIDMIAPKIHSISVKLINHQRYHRRFFIPNIIWSLPLGYLYSLIGRRIIGKLYIADSHCINCGICINQCPAKAIKTEHGQIQWNWKCEGCMRCINICPQKAIQVSFLRLLALIPAAFFNPLFKVYRLIPGSFFQNIGSVGKIAFKVMIDVVLFFLFFAIIDSILCFLSRIPFFKSITDFSITKFYKRYYLKNK
ncbi:MAG: EFR1 family ferrodoxin [Candidatus Cloacimonetes bacterium]|nr:EFR1 family ferrodoxin [Candidatus Cloacimonadota bacterium]